MAEYTGITGVGCIYYAVTNTASGKWEFVSQVHHPSLAEATGTSIDDRDHIYVTRSMGLGVEFQKGPNGAWTRVFDSVLNDVPPSRSLEVSTSRTNIKRGQMRHRAFRNVLLPAGTDGVQDGADDEGLEPAALGGQEQAPPP
jgi:hypothetical protein